ncbi:MAG: hypothetical protein ACP5QI_02130 [Candidatus Bathyarchaeia archaeon]
MKGFYNNLNAEARGLLAVNATAQIHAYGHNHLRAHQSLGAPPLGW